MVFLRNPCDFFYNGDYIRTYARRDAEDGRSTALDNPAHQKVWLPFQISDSDNKLPPPQYGAYHHQNRPVARFGFLLRFHRPPFEAFDRSGKNQPGKENSGRNNVLRV